MSRGVDYSGLTINWADRDLVCKVALSLQDALDFLEQSPTPDVTHKVFRKDGDINGGWLKMYDAEELRKVEGIPRGYAWITPNTMISDEFRVDDSQSRAVMGETTGEWHDAIEDVGGEVLSEDQYQIHWRMTLRQAAAISTKHGWELDEVELIEDAPWDYDEAPQAAKDRVLAVLQQCWDDMEKRKRHTKKVEVA